LLSKNLKVVEIKERKDDKRIMEILSSIVKILLSLGVPSDCKYLLPVLTVYYVSAVVYKISNGRKYHINLDKVMIIFNLEK
jgi:hypothetical protein